MPLCDPTMEVWSPRRTMPRSDLWRWSKSQRQGAILSMLSFGGLVKGSLYLLSTVRSWSEKMLLTTRLSVVPSLYVRAESGRYLGLQLFSAQSQISHNKWSFLQSTSTTEKTRADAANNDVIAKSPNAWPGWRVEHTWYLSFFLHSHILSHENFTLRKCVYLH